MSNKSGNRSYSEYVAQVMQIPDTAGPCSVTSAVSGNCRWGLMCGVVSSTGAFSV